MWPFKKHAPPRASQEAREALAASHVDLAEVRLQREWAQHMGAQLRETHEQNHFALALKATMQGGTR